MLKASLGFVSSIWKVLLNLEDLAFTLRPLGISSLRAKQYINIAEKLKNDFGDVNLDSLKRKTSKECKDYLTSLPGIGEKSARCVMMYSLGHDISPMDTHAIRVMTRVGLLPRNCNARRAHQIFDSFLNKVAEAFRRTPHTEHRMKVRGAQIEIDGDNLFTHSG